MAEVINARVEQATNARLADYFNNLNQEQSGAEEGMHERPAETGFDHGMEEATGENQVDNENNTVFEGYSLDSPVYSKSPPIISKARYIPKPVRSSSSSKLPSNYYKVILDSGCTDTMTAIEDLFDSITYFYKGSTPSPNTPHVLLGNSKTTLPIKGYGTIRIQLCGKVIKLYSYFVPNLGDVTLISSKQHTQYQGNYIHKESNSAMLAFPSFVVSLATDNEIHAIITKPVKSTNDYNETKSILTSQPPTQTAHLIPSSIRAYIPKDKQVTFQETVQFKPLHRNAQMPKRATKGSIGYDITSSTSI